MDAQDKDRFKSKSCLKAFLKPFTIFECKTVLQIVFQRTFFSLFDAVKIKLSKLFKLRILAKVIWVLFQHREFDEIKIMVLSGKGNMATYFLENYSLLSIHKHF